MDDEKTGQAATDTNKGGAAAPLTDKIIDVVVDGAAALTKAAAKSAVKRVTTSAKKTKAGKAITTAAKKGKKPRRARARKSVRPKESKDPPERLQPGRKPPRRL